MEKQLGADAPKINVRLKDTEELTCEKCGCNIFGEALFIRKLNRLYTGSETDSLIPIPTFYCVKCQHVNKELLPVHFREEDKNAETNN